MTPSRSQPKRCCWDLRMRPVRRTSAGWAPRHPKKSTLFAGGAQSTVALFGLILRQSPSGHVTWQNSGNKGFTGGVLAVAPLADGRVLVAGSFTSLLGQSRARLAMLRRNGTLDLAFNPA